MHSTSIAGLRYLAYQFEQRDISLLSGNVEIEQASNHLLVLRIMLWQSNAFSPPSSTGHRHAPQREEGDDRSSGTRKANQGTVDVQLLLLKVLCDVSHRQLIGDIEIFCTVYSDGLMEQARKAILLE